LLLARLLAFAEGENRRTETLVTDLNRLGRSAVFFTLPDAGELEGFRRRLRTFIHNAVALRNGETMLVPTWRVSGLEFGAAPTGTGAVVTLTGNTEDILGFQVVRLLETTGVDRLRKCECGRLFAKVGRREFCSARCQKRVYTRLVRRQQRLERSSRRTQHGKKAR
jgi:hypothetical protein